MLFSGVKVKAYLFFTLSLRSITSSYGNIFRGKPGFALLYLLFLFLFAGRSRGGGTIIMNRPIREDLEVSFVMFFIFVCFGMNELTRCFRALLVTFHLPKSF